MIRVALDTSALFVTQAGVARYIRGLLSGLAEMARPSIAIQQFAWERENFGFRQPQRSLKTVYRDIVWRCVVAPFQLRRLSPDLFHSPAGGYVRPGRSIRWTMTLHDLAVFRFPERYRPWHRHHSRRWARLALQADRVICISQFTADEAMAVLGIRAAKLEVVYNGCDFHPSAPTPQECRPELELPAEYFLFVGSLEPGKNLALLRQVYEVAASRGNSLPPLVIVGARWAGVPGEGRPPLNWHYLGRQPDAVLVYLYRRALALVFPSKYEGFGLPVAEAMALGCPVICAPVSSLPEVGGEAPFYAPLSLEPWLAALAEIAHNGNRRRECIEAGRQQAEKFSWLRCAERTAAVFESTVRHPQ